MNNYSYSKAIERNIGLVSEAEQKIIKNSRIAIAGVGAVGGSYLVNLTRMGVGSFKIADPDIFEMANLQRQAGAFISQLGQKKVLATKQLALDINPTLNIKTYEMGITESNIDEFLDDVDLVIDGIDAFQIIPRRLLYKKAQEKGVFVFCSAPLGFGATLQVFDPSKMSFDKYYNIDNSMTHAEQIASFLLGLAPNLLSKSQIDPKYVDFIKEKGPALACTISLSACIVTSEILKFLLNKEKLKCIPHAFYFDTYNRVLHHKRIRPIPFKWLQKLLLKIAFKKFPSLKELHLKEKPSNGSSESLQRI